MNICLDCVIEMDNDIRQNIESKILINWYLFIKKLIRFFELFELLYI